MYKERVQMDYDYEKLLTSSHIWTCNGENMWKANDSQLPMYAAKVEFNQISDIFSYS
jgi:hypothetical protein